MKIFNTQKLKIFGATKSFLDFVGFQAPIFMGMKEKKWKKENL